MVETLKNQNEAIKKQIDSCLSSSNICGQELRRAHYFLGVEIGKEIVQYKNIIYKKVALLIMMRAGLPFGLGVADGIEEKNYVDIFFSSSSSNDFGKYDVVLIVDAVINTGKTIKNIVSTIKKQAVIVAANVVSCKYLEQLTDIDIYATRISERSFTGDNVKTVSHGKGPDTGERLFSNSFFD